MSGGIITDQSIPSNVLTTSTPNLVRNNVNTTVSTPTTWNFNNTVTTAGATTSSIISGGQSRFMMQYPQVNSGTINVNNFTTQGTYYLGSGASYQNLPGTSVNGFLMVIRNTTGSNTKQIFFRQGTFTGTNPNTIQTFVRTWNGTTWSVWGQFAVTAMPAIAQLNTRYDLTPNSGFSGGTFQYLIDGANNVHLNINCLESTSSLVAREGDTLGTLPEGFPTLEQAMSITFDDGTSGTVCIGTDGSINLTNYTPIASGCCISGSISFLMDLQQGDAPDPSDPVNPIPNAPIISDNGGTSYPELSWYAIDGATTYNIYRNDTGLTPLIEINSGTTNTTYQDKSVVSGTVYDYAVTSVNDAGESSESNVVTITAP